MKGYIAIKGNAEKGSEIIKLLEMMGGNNSAHFTGRDSDRYYFIDNDRKCICNENIYEMEKCYNGVYMLFSYDTFNDNYPWRIGDIVNVIGRNDRIGLKVVKMQWGDAYNTMMYCLDCKQDGYGWWRAEDIEYIKYSDLKVNLDDIAKNIEFDLTNYSYEVKDGKLIIKEKKPKYPKTYKECFNICFGNRHHIVQVVGLDDLGDNKELFESFIKLKICRDAYLRIAGDWKPVHQSGKDNTFYTIHRFNNEIIKSKTSHRHSLLEFPNEEMRDAFYENFKDLIEECEELL